MERQRERPTNSLRFSGRRRMHRSRSLYGRLLLEELLGLAGELQRLKALQQGPVALRSRRARRRRSNGGGMLDLRSRVASASSGVDGGISPEQTQLGEEHRFVPWLDRSVVRLGAGIIRSLSPAKVLKAFGW
jgi:hypothetical protein